MLTPVLRRTLDCATLSLLVLVALACPVFAQVSAPALADPGMQIELPPGLDTSPGLSTPGGILRRSQTLAPVSPSSPTKTVLSLNALFFEGSAGIESGLRWRVFSDQPDVNGNHALVYESTDARPLLTLDPGGYIVHVVYGLASATRHVVLGAVAETERIVLNAGALRFTGTVADTTIPATELKFEIHRADDQMEELIGQIGAGDLLRLPAGSYQVTSTYGSANAKIISEVRVEPGKLTEAAVLHKAGRVALRLVGAAGAEVANANWSILTPGGDVVSETVPDVHDIVLAEGEYVAVARYDGEIYQKPFEIKSGQDERVDVATAR